MSEIEPQHSNPLIIIIDDNELGARHQRESMLPGCDVLTITQSTIFPDNPNAINPQRVSEYLLNIPTSDLVRAVLVLKDESFGSKQFWDLVLSHNPDALCLELGGFDPETSYDGRIFRLERADYEDILYTLRESTTLPNLKLFLMKIKYLAHQEALEAQRCDPESVLAKGNKYDHIYVYHNKKRFFNHRLYLNFLNILREHHLEAEFENFINSSGNIHDPKSFEILHLAWNMLFFLSEDKSEEATNSIERLRKLLC